jgi:hypothetical protein
MGTVTVSIDRPGLFRRSVTITAHSTVDIVEREDGDGGQLAVGLLIDDQFAALVLWKHTVGRPEHLLNIQEVRAELLAAIAELGRDGVVSWETPVSGGIVDQHAADFERVEDDEPELYCEGCGEHLRPDDALDDGEHNLCRACFVAGLPDAPTPAQQAERDKENAADMVDFIQGCNAPVVDRAGYAVIADAVRNLAIKVYGVPVAELTPAPQDSETLHAALRRHGYDSRDDGAYGRRTVYHVASGATVASFDAHEAWAWLATMG